MPPAVYDRVGAEVHEGSHIRFHEEGGETAEPAGVVEAIFGEGLTEPTVAVSWPDPGGLTDYMTWPVPVEGGLHFVCKDLEVADPEAEERARYLEDGHDQHTRDLPREGCPLCEEGMFES